MALFAALLLYSVWPWLPLPSKHDEPRTIVFFGFSVVVEAMSKGIFPTFQKHWREKTGQEVEFISSFGGSGTVRNQIRMGVPADLALLSTELDSQQLAVAGVIGSNAWHRLPARGVLNQTPFVILVRRGNPLRIQDFADLTRPGVKVVHPDPLTSGGANWAIIAEFGAGIRQTNGSPEAGQRMLEGIWKNVTAQAASARAARTQFDNGFGDALITYEQELVYDKMRGKLEGEIIYPAHTVRSEHILVRIEKNIDPEERELIDAFTEFLWSEAGQRIFVEYGFRSVQSSLNEANPAFGRIEDLFSIQDFGGWQAASQDIVDGIWKRKVLSQLHQ